MSVPTPDRLLALREVLAAIPYARFLGVEPELAGDELTLVMPFQERLVGNPMLPALHGGVIGGFLELAALAQLSLTAAAPAEGEGIGGSRPGQPRTIGLSVEYLRSGRPLTTYARAIVQKSGRRVANVRVEAWQTQRAAPVALLHGHFLLG